MIFQFDHQTRLQHLTHQTVQLLGLTGGLAAATGIFVGLAAAITVALIGGSWIAVRSRRRGGRHPGPVVMAYPFVGRSDDERLRSLPS